MPAPSPERIEQARRKAEQAKARLQALEARAGQEARKQDTRRKIILGGLLIDAAGSDQAFAAVLADLMQRIGRKQDREPFVGWAAPTPASLSPGVQTLRSVSTVQADHEPPVVQAPSP